MMGEKTTSENKSIQRFWSKWFDDKFELMLVDAILDVILVAEEEGRYGECFLEEEIQLLYWRSRGHRRKCGGGGGQ